MLVLLAAIAYAAPRGGKGGRQQGGRQQGGRQQGGRQSGGRQQGGRRQGGQEGREEGRDEEVFLRQEAGEEKPESCEVIDDCMVEGKVSLKFTLINSKLAISIAFHGQRAGIMYYNIKLVIFFHTKVNQQYA